MVDGHGRVVDYARISVTDRCNLRCIYCMPEEGVASIPHREILTFEEILWICRCLAGLGVSKIKITGGEPLVRKNCASLIGQIKKVEGIEKVTLTTNGLCLKDQMKALADAGVDAVNISLDTLDARSFFQITRREGLEQVLEGIREALKYPKISVKINSVPVCTDAETLVGLAGLAKNAPVHVRFIEMMPVGYGKGFPLCDEESIRTVLEAAYGSMVPCKQQYGNGPGHYFALPGFQGRIGFISAMTHQFCDRCNRVRLTADGYLRACLQYETGRDLKQLMRSGCSDKELCAAIAQVIVNKPACHNFYHNNIIQEEGRGMSQIGG